MISIRHSRDYCEEYWKIENYEKAISSDERWQCHHKLEFMPFSGKNVSKKFLIEQGMYYKVQPEALIFLPISEHRKLHMKGNKIGIGSRKGTKTSEEGRRNISEALKGKHPNISADIREKRRQLMIELNKSRKAKRMERK